MNEPEYIQITSTPYRNWVHMIIEGDEEVNLPAPSRPDVQSPPGEPRKEDQPHAPST